MLQMCFFCRQVSLDKETKEHVSDTKIDGCQLRHFGDKIWTLNAGVYSHFVGKIKWVSSSASLQSRKILVF